MRSLFCLLTAALAVGVSWSNGFANPPNPTPAARLNVPGTSLSFVPYLPLSPAGGFTGFENVEHQIAVLALEVPTPPAPNGDALSIFERIMTAESLRMQGVEVEIARRIMLEDREALLLQTRQTHNGILFRKYLLLLPARGSMAQIQISLPMDRDQRLKADISAMIDSFRIEQDAADPTTAYFLRLPQQWTLAKQAGIVDIYTPNGQFPIPPHGPYITVLNLNEAVAADRQSEFVKSKNLQRNYYTELRELKSVNVIIDDKPANLSIVSAVKAQTKQPVIMHYCYIFLPDTTYLVESRRGPEMSDITFEEIATSLKFHRDLR